MDITIIRDHHWAVGWVETLCIHESNITALERAEELQAGLMDDYPVLDEEDYSNRQYEARQESWKWLSIKERVRVIQKYSREDTSVFAARSEEMPQDWGITEYLSQD